MEGRPRLITDIGNRTGDDDDDMKIVCLYRTEEWSVDERRIHYIKAPMKYYGNRLHSYGSYITFSIRSRFGIEVALTGTQPVIIEGNGELIIMLCYHSSDVNKDLTYKDRTRTRIRATRTRTRTRTRPARTRTRTRT